MSVLYRAPAVRRLCGILLGLLLALLPALMAGTGRGLDDYDSLYPERLVAPLPPGALERPFGETVLVQGKVIEGPSKMENSAAEGRLLVQRINGVATQQGVVLRFDPVTSRDWWQGDHLEGEKLFREKERRLKAMRGKTFEMRGYERGEHVPMTNEEALLIETLIQGDSFHFKLFFVPLVIKPIPDVHFAPADFAGRIAELEGRAETRHGAACLIGAAGWELQIHDGAWTSDREGREIWCKGRIEKAPTGRWKLAESIDVRLLELGDQVGKEVKLDGVAHSSGEHRWIDYRGENVDVENGTELTSWDHRLSWKNVTIGGTLERLKPDQPGRPPGEPDARAHYVVRHANWSPVDLSWRKPAKIPQAPPLTADYLRSCGIRLKEDTVRELEKLESAHP